MSTLLLTTKLYLPPHRSNVVLRPRLIERLNEGLHSKLILISAPAGFGKTTLVGSWIDDVRLTIDDKQAATASQETIINHVAWLSLDEDDSDLTRFLTYLIAALQTITANLAAGVLDLLQSPQHPPIETMLTVLLNEITTIPDNFVLVLDDYHVIDSKSVDQILTFLIEHLPPQMHVVIATREDPQLPLARFRVRCQLTELRAADLRFTPLEAADFLNQVMGLHLSSEDVSALEARTEGWIAGLQLAALSMQGQQDTTSFITSFTGSHRFVMDYLVEEVLHQQSEGIQTFLLNTSILDRLCGPLCDAVLCDPSASGQNTLEYLEHANLFIIPLDNERQWYRYHHLFADLLRQRLHQHIASSTEDERVDVAELHRRASQWYAENGLKTEAFHHAIAAEDFERAAALVELAWAEMDRSFQSATWLNWVKLLPEELIRNRPMLCVGYAWALLDTGELEAGEVRLRDAEQLLNASVEMVIVDEEQFRLLPVTIATARAYLASAHGDVPGTVKYARRALDLVPEGDHLRRGTIDALLGLTYWATGDLEAAHRTFADGMASMQMTGNLLFAIGVTTVLADIRVAQGRLREAFQIYQQALQLAATQGELVRIVTPSLHVGLGVVLLEQGNTQTAGQHLLRSKELGEHGAFPDWQYRWCLAQARIKKIQGDLDGALELLHEAERVYFRGPMPDVAPVTAMKARVWLKQGRLTLAQKWVHESGLSIDDDLSYLREFEHITLARLLLAEYKRNHADRSILEAIGFLDRLLQSAEEGGRMGSMIEILVLQSLAYEAQGKLPLALVSLERALKLAEPEGYVRIFADEGLPMAQLLSQATVHGITPDYIKKLLAAFETEKQQSEDTSSLPSVPPVQPLLEPLRERELEVLRLIAQGLSNQEISERLFLALSTVKGHNQKIFLKLDVQRRTEAVARARELGLL